MPKLCKPTHKAIAFRVRAYYRHAQIHNYIPEMMIPIAVFGIKGKIKREGVFMIQTLIEELKEHDRNTKVTTTP